MVRAARYDLPLMLAIIGGDRAAVRPLVDLYRRALDAVRRARAADRGALARATSPTPTSEAREQLWPHNKRMRDRIGAERGWGPMDRGRVRPAGRADGSLYVGSPETVARKIAATARALGLARFDMKYSAGALPHELLMRSIELYGTQGDPAGARHAGVTAGRR